MISAALAILLLAQEPRTANEYLASLGVAPAVIERIVKLPALPEPPGDRALTIAREHFFIEPDKPFPEFEAFRTRVRERIQAIRRNPAIAANQWNTSDPVFVELDASFRVPGRHGIQRDMDVRNLVARSLEPDQERIPPRELEKAARYLEARAELQKAAADAQNRMIEEALTAANRELAGIVAKHWTDRGSAGARESRVDRTPFEEGASELHYLLQYTVSPDKWGPAHHRPFRDLDLNESLDDHRRRLAGAELRQLEYLAGQPWPDLGEVVKIALILRAEYAGFFSEEKANEALRKSFETVLDEAARQRKIDVILKVHAAQEAVGGILPWTRIQQAITSLALEDYRRAAETNDLEALLKVHAFVQSGFADPSKFPALGADENIDAIHTARYLAAVNAGDIDGILRAIAFSQTGLVSPRFAITLPDRYLTDRVAGEYHAARQTRDVAGLKRAYSFVASGLASGFVSDEDYAADLAAAGAMDPGIVDFSPNVAEAEAQTRALLESAAEEKGRLDELAAGSGGEVPGVAEAAQAMAERERSLQEDLRYQEEITNQAEQILEQMKSQSGAHVEQVIARELRPYGVRQDVSVEASIRARERENVRSTLAAATRRVGVASAITDAGRKLAAAASSARATIAARPLPRAIAPSGKGFPAPSSVRIAGFRPPEAAVRRTGMGASGTSFDRPAASRIDVTAFKDALARVFAAYENEDAAAFEDLLASDFSGSDRAGYAYSSALFLQAMRDDFRNLDRIEFSAQVGVPIRYYPEAERINIEFTWQRRALLAQSGAEWTLDGRNSTLVFSTDGASPKLASIEGDPIFGIARPTGEIVLSEGRLDGTKIIAPVVINSGETSSTNPSAIAPTITASASSLVGIGNLTVSFSASAFDRDGTIISYVWDFGDGTSSTEQNPSKTYPMGTYTARVTASDNDGATASTTITISVAANQSPTATIGGTFAGASPLTVNFTATASDPDGSIASYEWDFGDGQTSTLQNPAHIYSIVGFYTASLTVTDNLGAATTATQIISVANADFHVTGTLPSDTAWSGNVYIDGDVTIPVGLTATVAAATNIIFTGNYQINVSGTFRSTAANIRGQSSTPGYWKSIIFNSGAICDMTSNTISDGGSGTNTGISLYLGAVTTRVGAVITAFANNTLSNHENALMILGSTATFTGNTVSASQNGIYILGGTPTISGGTIANNTLYGLRTGDGTFGAAVISVTGVTFSGNRAHLLSHVTGPADQLNVSGNTFGSTTGSPGEVINLTSAGPHTFSSNTVSGAFADADRILYINGASTISNNTFNVTSMAGGLGRSIIVILAGNATISGNSITAGAGSSVVELISFNGSAPTVSNNTLDANDENFSIGISSTNASPIVTGNTIRNCANGMVHNTGNPDITGNTFTSCTQRGFDLFSGTATVRDNNITDNASAIVGTGTSTMDNCYLAGNAGAGAGVVDSSNCVPTSCSGVPQYFTFGAVTNPRNTPNP